jgi:hypothetical protein
MCALKFLYCYISNSFIDVTRIVQYQTNVDPLVVDIHICIRPPAFLLGFPLKDLCYSFINLSIVQVVTHTFLSWFQDGSPEGPPLAKKRQLGLIN